MPEERPPGSPGELTEESGALEHRTQELTDEVGAASHRGAPGEVLEKRFRIVRLIARGGMGEVYEALDMVLGTRVALKTLRVEQASSPRALERFRQELLLARKIGHPNVCRVFELHVGGPSEPPLFIAMEYLEGETLAERLEREGPLPEAAALEIVRQVAAALSAAHAEGVVHRDLKARNVMLVPVAGGGERAVVTDFGIARALDAVANPRATWDGPVGTPAYMAPEQLTGGVVTPATDIYGLGVLMYELTTGQLPFAGDTPQEVASERARSPPPEPRRVAAELSDRWNQTTRWCLSTEPAQRPQSAELVIQALLGERAVGGRRMRSAWVVAALALLVALSSVVWRWRHPATAPPRPALAVLQAANLTGDTGLDWLSVAVPEAVTAELEPTVGVRLLPASLVAERQISLGTPTQGRSGVEEFGSEPHRRLGEVLGLLALSFARGDTGMLNWSAWLETPGPEPPRAEVSFLAAADAVEPVARALAAGISRAMRWERASPRMRSPLIPAVALPTSEAARRSYVEGLRRLGRGDDRGAVAMFTRSVDAEPGFLPAHARLLKAKQDLLSFWWELPLEQTDEPEKKALQAAAGAPDSPERAWVEAWGLWGSWDAHTKLQPFLDRNPDDPELLLADVSVSPRAVGLSRLAEIRAAHAWARGEPRVDLLEATFQLPDFQFQAGLGALARGMGEAERRGDRLLMARILELRSRIAYLMIPTAEAAEASLEAERGALDAGAAGLATAIRLARAQQLMWWGKHRESSALYRALLSDLRAEGQESIGWRARVLFDVAFNEYELGDDDAENAALAELASLPLTPRHAGRLASLRLQSALFRLPAVGREGALRQALAGCGANDGCRRDLTGLLVLELLQQNRTADAGALLQELGPQARGTGGWAWIYLRVMSALGRCPEAYGEIQPFVHSNVWLTSLIGGARLKAALASCLIEMNDLAQAESMASSIAPYFVGSESLTERSNWLGLEARLALARGAVSPDLPARAAALAGSPGMERRPCLRAEVRMYQGRLLPLAGQSAPARRILAVVAREATQAGCLRTARLAREAGMRL